ncbi:MAG: RHS repeat-associated core domain-containing protein [Verrucomicrobiota bacterium]
MNPDPTSQGWVTSETTTPGVDANLDGLIDSSNVGAIVDSEGVSWQIYDQFSAGTLNFPSYRNPMTAEDFETMYAQGWVYEFTVRAVQVDRWAGFTGWAVSSGDNPGWNFSGSMARVGFFFGFDPSGDFWVRHNGDQRYSGNTNNSFHTIRAVCPPESTTFEWFINGVSQGAGELITSGGFQGLVFEQGSSADQFGAADWKRVSLSSEVTPIASPTIPVTGTVLFWGDEEYNFENNDMTGLLALSSATSTLATVDEGNSESGFYRLDIDGSDDIATGAMVASVALNGRFQTVPSGSDFATATVVPISGPCAYNFSISRTSDFMEYNIDTAFGWFPFSEFTAAVATGDGFEPVLTELVGSAGISLGAGEQVVALAEGQILVDLTDLNAPSDDGVLLASVAQGDAKVALVEPKDDGTFNVYVRDSTSSDLKRGAISFVYLPFADAGQPGQRLVASARVQSDAGIEAYGGAFSLGKLDRGRWALAIPGHNNDSGTLLTTPMWGGGNSNDNIITYEWDAPANCWIIESRWGQFSNFGIEDGATADELMFNFAFFAKDPIIAGDSPMVFDEAVVRQIRPHGDSLIGNGIDTATGAFSQGRELLMVEGVRPLALDINYNSRLTTISGPLGTSWSHNYQAKLEGNLGQEVVIRWDAHRKSVFTFVEADRAYVGADEDVQFANLTAMSPSDELPDTYWRLMMEDGDIYYFGKDGRLNSVHNVIRQPINLEYDGAGRLVKLIEPFSEVELTLAYNEINLIETVTDELGRVVTLTYDEDARLICIPAPVIAEVLESGDAITSEPIPDNDPAGTSIIVDVPEGGIISGILIRSLEIRHSIPGDLTVSITSPEGTEILLDPVANHNGVDAILFDGQSFDSFRNEERMGDWVLQVADNADGVIGTIESFSFSFIESDRKVHYIYDDANRIVLATDSIGEQILGAEYDEFGRIIRQMDGRPESPDAIITYEAIDQSDDVRTTYIDPLGNTWAFVHDSEFHLMSATNPVGGSSTFTYDEKGLRLTLTDARNHTTSFTYNENGDVASTTDPLGNTTSFEYGDEHDITRIIDAHGEFTQLVRFNGRLVEVVDALENTDVKEYYDNGQVSRYIQSKTSPTVPGGGGAEPGEADIRYALDDRERVARATNPNGDDVGNAEQSLTYDLAGRVITSVDFGDNVTEIFYTPSGDIRTQIDPESNVSRRDYDHRGRLYREVTSRGFETTYTYDGNGNITSSTNAIGETTIFEYDNDDRLVAITNPRGSVVAYEYDAFGRVVGTTDALGRTERTVYDAVGNIVEVYDASGTLVLKITYDERDLPIRIEDAQGHVTTAEYDALMRKVKTTDPLGLVYQYTYDELGRLTRTVDPQGRTGTTTYLTDDVVDTVFQPVFSGQSSSYFIHYDFANNLTDVFGKNGAPESFAYNSRNLLSRSLSLQGRRVDFSYDDLGRLIESDPSSSTDNTRTYEYDVTGNLLKVFVSDNGVETLQSERTFDPLGRISTYTDHATSGSSQTLRYVYDRAGNLTRMIYPDGSTLTYTYDDTDRPIQITDWANRITVLTWDELDRLRQVDFPNGVQRTMRYDAAGNLIYREDLEADGEVIISYSYGYDSAGRLQSEVAYPELPAPIPSSATLTYDDFNVIQTYNGSNIDTDFDGFVVGASAVDPTFGSINHNTRGHLTSTSGYSYHYDEEDRLVGWQPAGSADTERIEFFANPSGRLSQVLTQSQAGSLAKRFVYGVGLFYEEDVATGEIKVLHYDYRGSTVALSDDNGDLAGRVSYTPYGEIASRTGETDTLFLYNGLYGVLTSPEGMNYMRFRWYLPQIRRFLSRDIHLGSIGDLSSLNRFSYARGNPAMYVDPEGEFWWIVGGAAVGAAINVGVTFVADLADDGQLNTPPEEYAAAAIGGALFGGITAATGGLGGAVFGGAIGAATENLVLAGLRGEAVDFQSVMTDAILGAGSGALGHGAGKLAGKVGAKAFAKTFGKPGRFMKFINKISTPDKIARRRAVGSFPELLARSAKKERNQALLKFFVKSSVGIGSIYASRAFDAEPPPAGGGGGGFQGNGNYSIIDSAVDELNQNRLRQYGEYIHFDLYLDAVRLADRPVPSHPTNSLTGF